MASRKSNRKASNVAKFDASHVSTKGRVTKTSAKAKPVKKAVPKPKAMSQPKKPVVEDNTDYEVESIWGVRRFSKYYDDIQVLIKWVGYPKPTWEPLENAKDSSPQLLEPFKKAIKRVSGQIKLPNEDELLSAPAEDVDEDGREYEVEDIIGVQYSKENGRIEYSVKWKGYAYKDCTWEPQVNVEDLPEYLDFFSEAVSSLAEIHGIGVDSRRSSGKKRQVTDAVEQNGSETTEENGGEEVSAPKRGRGRKPQTVVASGVASKTKRRRRK